MADESGGGGKFTYFLAGMGIGALIGILFAPKSGEETREYLSTKYGEGRDYAQRRAKELRDQADDYLERGRKVVGRTKENLSAAMEAGKQAYREASTRGEAAES
jgi:gas vesicle protein